MTNKNKHRARLILSVAFFLFAVGMLAVPILMMVGCAAASSEITPAESKAAQEQVEYRGATSETTTVEIIIGDSSEVK